jgi:catecholate siderophore receptor
MPTMIRPLLPAPAASLVRHAAVLALVTAVEPTVATAQRPHGAEPTRGHATPPRGAVRVDSLNRQPFDVPAQSLGDALAEFARQAGVRVTVDSAAVSRLRTIASPGVDGVRSTAEALRTLLGGTGLVATFTDERTVVIAPAGAPVATRAQALGRVVVQASVRRRDYGTARTTSATRTDTPLRDTPQAVTVVGRQLIADQAMQSMADVVRWIPGIVMGQGEGHRDAPTIRGNSTTADFYVDGIRDDVQYLRDLYNVERVEALKGSNAMIFGRGGGGGVLNRVLKDAQWAPTRELTLTGASFDQRRATLDLGQGTGGVAARVNGMYEQSGMFRREGRLERFGVNPTLAFVAGPRTLVRLGYELFGDDRTVDRGIPSFQGRPSPADARTFFGDPDASQSRARVHAASALVEHTTPGGLTIRNRTRYADHEKFYANVFPTSALNAAGTQLSLGAYDATLNRRNAFNQTDLIVEAGGGAVRHTLLAGVEVGRQGTDNIRNTGYFGNTATAAPVAFGQPTVTLPVTYRQSATDANNHVLADVAAVYAQDQLALGAHWQAVVGVRAERFALRLNNYRNGETLRRTDNLLSPRAGLVFKPTEPVSLYGSYALSYLPSAGDQFAGAHADVADAPARALRQPRAGAQVGAASVARAQRGGLPAGPGEHGRPGPHRSDARRADRQPAHARLRARAHGRRAPRVAGGRRVRRAGCHDHEHHVGGARRADGAAGAAPDGVALEPLPARPGTRRRRGRGAPDAHVRRDRQRGDAARLHALGRRGVRAAPGGRLRAQVNVENLLDVRYFPTSHGNNNILPGAGRTLRVTLATGL